MSHWGKRAMIIPLTPPLFQIPSFVQPIFFFPQPPARLTALAGEGRTFLLSHFQGRIRRWGYPDSSYMKPLSFSIYCSAAALWNETFLFFKRSNYMILSLIFLYLCELVIENRSRRRLKSLNADCTKPLHKALKSLLIIFSFFLSISKVLTRGNI